MHRKHFLTQALLALPALTNAKQIHHMLSAEGGDKPFVVKAGASRFGDSIRFLGVHPNDLKISGKDTGGQLSVFDYTGFAQIGPMLHVHLNQDEIFTVVSGNYRFVVGNETHELGPGETIFLPRNIPHTWIQLSQQGRMIYMLQPAGKMEEFFMVMNQLKAPPSPAEMDKIHEAHGMKVVGPPLSL